MVNNVHNTVVEEDVGVFNIDIVVQSNSTGSSVDHDVNISVVAACNSNHAVVAGGGSGNIRRVVDVGNNVSQDNAGNILFS